MKLVHALLFSLFLGVAFGRVGFPNTGNSYELALYILMFLIGIELGASTINLKVGRKSVSMAVLTMIGSLVGGLLIALLLGIAPKWGLAIGAGCGWYSLTGPLIAQYSALYGAVGFLANLIRELITMVLYPFLSSRLDPEKLIAMGGATTMDTTLPIIRQFGGRETAMIAFVHGFLLTAVIPFLLSLIL